MIGGNPYIYFWFLGDSSSLRDYKMVMEEHIPKDCNLSLVLESTRNFKDTITNQDKIAEVENFSEKSDISSNKLGCLAVCFTSSRELPSLDFLIFESFLNPNCCTSRKATTFVDESKNSIYFMIDISNIDTA